MPYPGLLHPEPLSLRQTTADPYLHRRDSQFYLSLCGVPGSWCTQGLLEPSEHLWQVRGLILNSISPLLPSCWLLLCPWTLGIFYGGIQHSPVGSCSAVSCSFGVLAGEDECTSFYPTILCWTHIYHPATFGGTPSPGTSLMKQC